MVSTFTPNIQLEEPARGDQVGVWDTPVNNNTTLIDLVCGGRTNISLNNSNVVLSSPQYQSKTIIFGSTLTGSVIITFPTSFIKSYEIWNNCTGSSAFTITLQTTLAGGWVVCAPPGEVVDITNFSGSLAYRNFGRIGSYWDYAGSSVPAWVSGCTNKPYLNCDGTTFSAAAFPVLATILGSTTLPDARGRGRTALNQGTGRMSAAGGVNGDTVYAGGGADTVTLATSQIPAHSHTVIVTDPGHFHNMPIGGAPFSNGWPSNGQQGSVSQPTNSAVTGITAVTSNTGGGAAHVNVQPTYIGGLTLIRSF